MINMPKEDRAWHEQDMADEMAEYFEDQSIIMKWSELSDVVYTCSRGRWSGHDITFPFARWQYALGLVYMYPKYTSRWLFYRRAGKKLGKPGVINQVRNPKKTAKLHTIADQYGLDKQKFQAVCESQLKHWLLFP